MMGIQIAVVARATAKRGDFARLANLAEGLQCAMDRRQRDVGIKLPNVGVYLVGPRMIGHLSNASTTAKRCGVIAKPLLWQCSLNSSSRLPA